MYAEIQMYKINRDLFNTSNLKQTVNVDINSGVWKHFYRTNMFFQNILKLKWLEYVQQPKKNYLNTNYKIQTFTIKC